MRKPVDVWYRRMSDAARGRLSALVQYGTCLYAWSSYNLVYSGGIRLHFSGYEKEAQFTFDDGCWAVSWHLSRQHDLSRGSLEMRYNRAATRTLTESI